MQFIAGLTLAGAALVISDVTAHETGYYHSGPVYVPASYRPAGALSSDARRSLLGSEITAYRPASVIDLARHRSAAASKLSLPVSVAANELASHRSTPPSRAASSPAVAAHELTLRRPDRAQERERYDQRPIAGRGEPQPYVYDYAVSDQYTGTNFAKVEQSDGHSTHGAYSVALPDGRVQHVSYVADDSGGYNAEVSYEDGGPFLREEPLPAYGAVPAQNRPAAYDPTYPYRGAVASRADASGEPATTLGTEQRHESGTGNKDGLTFGSDVIDQAKPALKTATSSKPRPAYKTNTSYKTLSGHKLPPTYKPIFAKQFYPSYQPIFKHEPTSTARPVRYSAAYPVYSAYRISSSDSAGRAHSPALSPDADRELSNFQHDLLEQARF